MNDLTTYIENMTVPDSDEIGAVEKMIYQFEPWAGNVGSWNTIMMELAKFHSMCGNYAFNYLTKWDLELEKTGSINIKYHIPSLVPRLPSHNAVAFFQKFMKRDISKQHQQYMIQHVFPYALASHGFVFGTVFGREDLNCVRPCDMDYVVPYRPDPNILKGVLMSHAQIKSGRNFISERMRWPHIFRKISNQRICIEEWIERYKLEGNGPSNDFPAAWSGDIDEWESMFSDFFNCYNIYCTSQINEKDLYKRAETNKQLEWIKLSAHFIFRMERLTQRLDDIKKIADQEKNIFEKKRWLSDFKKELSDELTVMELDAMRNISPKTVQPSLEKESLYAYILRPNEISKTTLKYYPLLDEAVAVHRLKKSERNWCWYRQHPVARIINHLCHGPRRKTLREVLPFYFLDHFIHKEKPLRPFTRKIYHFYPDKLTFDGEISFCEHPYAVRFQECHYGLYQFLLAWCDRYYPKEWDRKLCNALYTFYRPHLVTTEPSAETNFLGNEFSLLKEAISQALDIEISIFPQYAEDTISANDFYYFYYVNTDPKVRKLRRDLQKLVTDDIAERYKKIAFLDPGGLGYSLHSKEWHQRIANFLANVIRKDKSILQYTGENTALNLAQIELAIQFICCQKIRQKMTQDVLCYCKKILGPG